MSCTENETSRLRHEGRLPGRPFSLSAAPFPCFYRVGRLWVIWKQKPWFLKACKSAASNKILTDLFFLNQTYRLKPPARETKERKQEGFSNDFANSSYNVIQLKSYSFITFPLRRLPSGLQVQRREKHDARGVLRAFLPV